MRSKLFTFFSVMAVLAFVSLSCNLPGTRSQEVNEQTAVALTVAAELTKSSDKYNVSTSTQTAGVNLTETATVTQPASQQTATLTATPFSNHTATQTPIPCNQARFVTDVTYPDDTQVLTGSGFIKTWRLKNEGTCTWNSSYQIIFAGGDQMGAPNAVAVTSGSVPPNGTVDVSVNMTAPAAPGTYTGNWRLRAPDGTVFGIVNSPSGNFWVKIKAVSPTSVPPTFTPTSPPPALPDLIISDVTWSPDPPIEDTNTHVKVTVYNQGNATATNFTVRWWGLETFANPSCEWNVASLVAHGGYVLECDFTFASHYAPMNTTAHVDDENNVLESDESNNKFKKLIDVN
ncbi:MAG: hypothetical protein HPY45_05740 [Anaerolineae bacterium]|nr:hypothetical protein [Anaerolineae bacterium]